MEPISLVPAEQRSQQNLVIAALGVVFGDIGTSPLYTIKECFSGTYRLDTSPENILGILSLVLWSLILVISLKYVAFIMRADNRGEGGIMALISLIGQKAKLTAEWRGWLVGLGLAGAALFYGDGVITPAISVLSAVEGLEVLQPELHPYVVPITLAVLVALFALQQRGTARVGALFGPVMLIWFVSLGVFGALSIARSPAALAAVNPLHAVHFFLTHGWHALLALGGVVLAITGGEALYADMGHFGRTPIRKAWFLVALPALLLNYFGQGALLMRDPGAVQNPFYLLVPPGVLALMIGLATVATIIASQAVISGAFSLTAQAIQLGFCPRLSIHYTSEEGMGQIYIPWINWMLLLGIVGLVLGFESSTHLAAAYGIAVTGTMTLTTILALVVAVRVWQWSPLSSSLLAAGFLGIDLAFFSANIVKVVQGGWFPLAVGGVVFTLMTTWKRGRDLMAAKLREESVPLDRFLAEIAQHPPLRVPGTAVFLTGNQDGVPYALLHNLEHNHMLHETVVFMTVLTESVPRVAPDKRREVRRLGEGLFRINLHYGYMEQPNLPRVLKSSSREFDIDLADTNFFLSRETVVPSSKPSMARWQLRLFIGLTRNTGSVARYFRIPAERVVELGAQVAL